MKRLRNLLLFSALWLQALGQAPTPSVTPPRPAAPNAAGGSAVVAGTVLNSVTRKPLEGVHVALMPLPMNPAPSFVYGAMSDAAGHFSIQGLPPENYYLMVERQGFIRVPGKDAPARLSITVKSGQRLDDLTLEMAPRSILAGRVVDEYGDPVMDAYVEAVPQRPLNDFMRYKTSTNDRGEFRIPVAPGKYYLKVPRWMSVGPAAEIRTDGTVESDYLETFYPGATTVDAATLVEARPRRELNALEIHLAWTAVLGISGIVTGVPEDALSISLSVEWGPDADDVSSASSSGWAASSSRALDHTFHLGHLSQGFYRIYASCSSGGQELRSPTAEISLAGSNVEDLRLALAPGGEVTGTVVWTGSPPAAPATDAALTVRLERVEFMDFNGARAQIGPGGSFMIKSVFAGRYRVTTDPLPENSFVKTVRVNGTAVAGGIVDFTNGADGADLRIVLSAHGGQISGHVEDEKGIAPWPAGQVVLFPDDADLTDDKPSLAGAGADSAFKFQGLAPGRYWLLAIPEGVDINVRSPLRLSRFIAQHRSTALWVEIKEGDNLTRDVKLPPGDADETTN
jgi:Carboxypeptidase regulatory-like domain